jgi:hypothetical protein
MNKPLEKTLQSFETWLDKVRSALSSINMPLDEWQQSWPFDFEREYKAGIPPANAAESANRFWWHEQNKALRQDCKKTPGCWLPRDHQGACEPL